MEITEDKVLTQMFFVTTALSVCSNSISSHQEFQQEMISDWELSRV